MLDNTQDIVCDNQNSGQLQQEEEVGVGGKKNILEKMPNNVKYPVVSFFVALFTYSFMKVFIPSGAGYYLECLLAAALSGVALFAISKVVYRNNSRIEFGSSVFYWIFLFMTINMIGEYFSPSSKTEDVIPSVIQESHTVRVDVLYPGVTVLELKTGEESNWLAFPPDGLWDYSIASPDYDYVIKFSDGTSYQGGPSTVIPEKNHAQFKIVANKAQFITVNVKQKT